MIYSNIDLKAQAKKMSFGDLTCITLGEYGRGRQEVVLPCPADVILEANTVNKKWSIGPSKSGKPRIVTGNSDCHLLLTTYGGYTRRGNGFALYHKSLADNMVIEAKGNGADGDAGRIGTWTAFVIKIVKFPFFLLLDYSGGKRSRGVILASGPDDIIEVKEDELAHYLDATGSEWPLIKFLPDSRDGRVIDTDNGDSSEREECVWIPIW